MIFGVCMVGDSVPNVSFSFFYQGGGWSNDAALIRTEQAAQRLGWRGYPVSGSIWANYARPQWNIGHLETDAPNVDALINPDYSAVSGRAARKYILVVKIGTNQATANYTLEAARIRLYCIARRAAGWYVILMPITSGNMAGSGGASADTNYIQPLNAIFATYTTSDGVDRVGSAADATMYGTGAYSNTTYFSDGIHPTEAGHTRIAPTLLTQMDSLIDELGGFPRPTNMAATSGSSITIEFTTPSTGLVFRLYRSTTDMFQTSSLLLTITAPTSPTVTTFDDTGVSGTPYFYWLTRYDSASGSESLPTQSVTGTPT